MVSTCLKSMFARLLATYFDESALLVYRYLIRDKQKLVDSYDDLVKALSREFATRGGLKTAELFSKNKSPLESCGKFFNTVSSLAVQTFPDMDKIALDQIIKSQFINGLDARSRRQLLNRAPRTDMDAYKVADRLKSTNVIMGAQPEHRERSGATGELNAISAMDRENLMDNYANSLINVSSEANKWARNQPVRGRPDHNYNENTDDRRVNYYRCNNRDRYDRGYSSDGYDRGRSYGNRNRTRGNTQCYRQTDYNGRNHRYSNEGDRYQQRGNNSNYNARRDTETTVRNHVRFNTSQGDSFG